MLRLNVKQTSLIDHPGPTLDINSRIPDPYLIKDPGCTRSAEGIACAAVLCNAMNIQFKLREMNSELFLHGHGKKCSDAEVTIEIWDLSVADLSRTDSKILFYVTRAEGFLLLENEVLHRSYQL